MVRKRTDTTISEVASSAGESPILASRASRRTSDAIAKPLLAACAIFSGTVVLFVLYFVFEAAWPVFAHQGWEFVTQANWDEAIDLAWSEVDVTFGAFPLIAGTVITTVGALVCSIVLGLGAAIFLAELAPERARRPIEAVVQLLSGIPSVVFGLVGMALVIPALDVLLPADAMDVVTDIPLEGASLLAGIIVLTFMILPFFVTVAVDALRAVPKSYTQGGLALGMTRWRSIVRIQLPTAAPGLLAGAVLAAARGIGEAIALSMVAGSLAYTPSFEWGLQYFPFMPIRTMASAIVETGGEAMSIPVIEAALFGLAALLLVGSLALSVSARGIVAWYSNRMSISTDRSL